MNLVKYHISMWIMVEELNYNLFQANDEAEVTAC